MMENVIVIKEMKKQIQELYDFIERLESTTKDSQTAQQIRQYLEEKGVWN